MQTTLTKVLSLEELAIKAQELRKQGKRIVLCHGAFDLLHAGHIRYLKSACREGDVLFVTVTSDEFVNKGPGRPVFSQDLRVENLGYLNFIDFIAVNNAPTAVNLLSEVKPDAYVKGPDYKKMEDDITGNIYEEKKAVEAHGGKLVFTDDITFSSTSLLNEHFGVFPPETKSYLQGFRQTYSPEEIIRMLQGLQNLNVLVIGDAIVDEYHYVDTLGQSSKGANLAVKFNSKEQFAGGSLAVANHVAGFVNNVTLVTGLGRQNSYEEFIRSKLQKNITLEPFFFRDAPTIVKRRYVNLDLDKLFEVYFYNDEPSQEDTVSEVCAWLGNKAAEFDIVIVPDFGNGFISAEMIQKLCDKARFLAVNTQVNSGNRGYHSINRYPRADFVSLNGPELRIATHNRHDSYEGLAKILIEKIGAKHFAVTLGSEGALLLSKSPEVTYRTPILSTKVLDRIGAGDTFLSLTGLCLGGGLDSDVALFVGSAAAALEVQVVCNREPVIPVNLFKYLTTLLK
ncbi:MAG: cytidyltransferase [Nitrosomonadaceae bacterium]|nr:cytidyltransferase [Nitrosomonadaceae bacterium]|tara:strand:- start:271 stop:1800 length:1530 start_codon:yes stop_codon:yes gene_type:complete